MPDGHFTTLPAPIVTGPCELTFTVLGTPQQQGSKTPWGDEANKLLKPWRAGAKADAVEAMQKQSFQQIMVGPVQVVVTFVFPRPKAHYRSGKLAHLLRDDAPHWKQSTPDTDKLQRAVGDSLTGIAIKDDSQIARWVTEKVYGDQPRTEITIGRLERTQQQAAAAA